MQTARIEARVGVRATPERLWDIIADLPGWSRWNPHETDLQGVIGFGAPLTLTERLPDLPEREVKAAVREWTPESQLVWTERRGFLFNAMRYFEIEALDAGACIFAHGVILTGLRGELFHDRHRPRIRSAYDAVAENLRRLAEG